MKLLFGYKPLLSIAFLVSFLLISFCHFTLAQEKSTYTPDIKLVTVTGIEPKYDFRGVGEPVFFMDHKLPMHFYRWMLITSFATIYRDTFGNSEKYVRLNNRLNV